MGTFLQSFFDEVMARRRRIASTIGPLAQGIFDLALLGGVVIGSLGLFSFPWMPAVAPWGFALPVVYLVGHGLLDARRQAALGAGHDPEEVKERGDLFAVLFSMAWAALGAATFMYALQQEPEPPPPPPAEEWTPPENVPELDITR
jgi:hypothetical protein